MSPGIEQHTIPRLTRAQQIEVGAVNDKYLHGFGIILRANLIFLQIITRKQGFLKCKTT